MSPYADAGRNLQCKEKQGKSLDRTSKLMTNKVIKN